MRLNIARPLIPVVGAVVIPGLGIATGYVLYQVSPEVRQFSEYVNECVYETFYLLMTGKLPGVDRWGNPIRQGRVAIVTSISPEDKFGPAGYDAPGTPTGSEQRFLVPGETFAYRIEMWNKPDAPVPTQDATIYDFLDPAVFDLSTFEFPRGIPQVGCALARWAGG